ncbi:MAG: DNA-binding protein, partial [Thermoprotei archaeon]
MKLPDEWVEKADFLIKDAERHLEEGVYWITCFEAQQAAELYLKALHLALTELHP